MRRTIEVVQMVVQTTCDLCGRPLDIAVWAATIGPLDFCRRCGGAGRCESCRTYWRRVWAGNCLACWRSALVFPRVRERIGDE